MVTIVNSNINTSNYQTLNLLINDLDNKCFQHDSILELIDNYKDIEKHKIYETYVQIRFFTLTKDKSKWQRFYIAEGDACTGKSTYIEDSFKQQSSFFNPVYIDADRTCLQAIVGHEPNEDEYKKWHSASIFISYLLLSDALKSKYDIIFGSTLNLPQTLPYIQNHYKYITHLLYFTCDEIKMCLKKLEDYRNNAEEVIFFYRDNINAMIKVAEWKKFNHINVFNEEAYLKMIALHDKEKPGFFKKLFGD